MCNKKTYIIDWRQHDPNPDPVSAFIRGLGLDLAAVVPKVKATDIGAVNASDSWRGLMLDWAPHQTRNLNTDQIVRFKSSILSMWKPLFVENKNIGEKLLSHNSRIIAIRVFDRWKLYLEGFGEFRDVSDGVGVDDCVVQVRICRKISFWIEEHLKITKPGNNGKTVSKKTGQYCK